MIKEKCQILNHQHIIASANGILYKLGNFCIRYVCLSVVYINVKKIILSDWNMVNMSEPNE